MQLRITIAMCMVEIRNRKTLHAKVNICKSDVKIGDYADSLYTCMVIRQQRPPVIRQQLPLMISGICSPLNTQLFLFVLEINKS